MLIRDIMSAPARSVAAKTSLSDAYRIMREEDIRHLPVVDDERLVGIVTDRDLRLVTSSLHSHPFEPHAAVSEIMSRDVVTATRLDPVEEAARLMRRRKIGCLPVVDGERVAGIVTGTDLLDALMRLTGLESSSSRLEVILKDEPGALAHLTALVTSQGFNIHSMLTYPDPPGRVAVILRINTINLQPLVRVLNDEAMDVVWPRPKTWSR